MMKRLAPNIAAACFMAGIFGATSVGQARPLDIMPLKAAAAVLVADNQQTVTGPGGKSATRSRQLNCSPDDRSCSATSQVTGPGGKSASRSKQLNCSSDDPSCSSSSQVTGSGGQSATRSRQLNCSPDDQSCSSSGQVTGPGGKSATRSRQRSRE